MNTADIKDGQIVVTRSGAKYYRCGDRLINDRAHLNMWNYNSNGLMKDTSCACDDIVKVMKMSEYEYSNMVHLVDANSQNFEQVQWFRNDKVNFTDIYSGDWDGKSRVRVMEDDLECGVLIGRCNADGKLDNNEESFLRMNAKESKQFFASASVIGTVKPEWVKQEMFTGKEV